MTSIPFASLNIQALQNPLLHTLTEMSTLSIEQLQLLANFFKFELAKHNIRLEVLQACCVGAAGITCITALSPKNNPNMKGFLVGTAFVSGIATITLGLVLLAKIQQKNIQSAWYDRCVQLINLKTEVTQE